MPKKIYAVRKRSGHWTVWSEEELCLNFESYDEAIETAHHAALVLARKRSAEPRLLNTAASPSS
jgi:hypothetical protein